MDRPVQCVGMEVSALLNHNVGEVFVQLFVLARLPTEMSPSQRRRQRKMRSKGRLDVNRSGLGWVSQLMGWVGSGHTKWTHGQLCAEVLVQYVASELQSTLRRSSSSKWCTLFPSIVFLYTKAYNFAQFFLMLRITNFARQDWDYEQPGLQATPLMK